VGINTSSNEGWGLVSFEHAATRTAQVVPKHASLDELWTGTAEMGEPVMASCDHQINCDLHLLSPEAVAAALESLCDQNHRHRVAGSPLCPRHSSALALGGDLDRVGLDLQ
jgi:D-inositol-3-phosphate glycosyltransferase